MTLTAEPTPIEVATAEAVLDRVFESVLGTMDLYSIYLGHHLGYYDLLANGGSLTPAELAEAASTDERYVREWLEQQAVTGLVEVAADNGIRRYALGAAQAEALTNPQSLAYVPAFARQVLASGFKLDDIVNAHRSGGGVSWDEFGDEMRDSQGDMNRPVLENVLAQEWLSSIPAIDEKLKDGGTVADIGCGHGWSSIGVATTYPQVVVDGFDIDAPSIETARRNAAETSTADRIHFHAIDAGDPWIDGGYDLVMAIEMVHDLPDPVATLSTMKRIADDDGIVIVADMNVAEEFDPEAGDIERLMYGYSNFICLPDGKAHSHSAATGTMIRPDILRGYARQAGFEDIVELPIEGGFWKFYQLV